MRLDGDRSDESFALLDTAGCEICRVIEPLGFPRTFSRNDIRAIVPCTPIHHTRHLQPHAFDSNDLPCGGKLPTRSLESRGPGYHGWIVKTGTTEQPGPILEYYRYQCPNHLTTIIIVICVMVD